MSRWAPLLKFICAAVATGAALVGKWDAALALAVLALFWQREEGNSWE